MESVRRVRQQRTNAVVFDCNVRKRYSTATGTEPIRHIYNIKKLILYIYWALTFHCYLQIRLLLSGMLIEDLCNSDGCQKKKMERKFDTDTILI